MWLPFATCNRSCFLYTLSACHACVAALLLLSSCSRTGPKSPTEADKPVSVRLLKISPHVRPVDIAVSGSVMARETVTLGFQVAGRISSVAFEEGDPVRRGEVIAQLDDTDYRIGVDAAEAKAAQARAALEKAQAGARIQELARARIAYEQREDEYRRMKQLYDKQSLAPYDFKKVEAAYLAAKEQYEMAREGARQEDKAMAQAALAEAEAGVAIARKHLDDTRLRATVSGLVAVKHTEAGQMTGTGTPVLTLMATDPVDITVGVPESDITSVSEGQQAVITAPALPGQTFEGRVRIAGIAAEPASRTFTVKIRVPNPKLLLRPGMIAVASIIKGRTMKVITAPGEAIVRDPQGATMVYVCPSGEQRAYARRVESGTVFGTEVEIREGLAEGDRVVVAGQNKLREGSPVVEAAGDVK